MENALIETLSSTPPSSEQLESYEKIGIATYLLCNTKLCSNLPVWYLSHRIVPAIKHRQIQILYNERNYPIAYLTWAFLSLDVEQRIINDPSASLHESEWNEGKNLWVLDFVAPYGNMLNLVRYAIKHFLPEHSYATALRCNTDGSLRKITLWKKSGVRTLSIDYFALSPK
jgi:hemolysin-activating ACP:hemolysin acyltransferase